MTGEKMLDEIIKKISIEGENTISKMIKAHKSAQDYIDSVLKEEYNKAFAAGKKAAESERINKQIKNN